VNLRCSVMAAVLCLPACAVGALGFSYGGGLALNFSPVTFNGTYSGTTSQVTSQAASTSVQFLDATYAVLQIGYFLNRGSTQPASADVPNPFSAVLTGLSLGVAAKLPIRIGPVEVFPILGVEYVLNLTYADDKGDDLKSTLSTSQWDLSELWLKGGVGVDILFGSLFVRPMVVAGVKPYAVSTMDSTHPTGSVSLTLGYWKVDAVILFGCRF